MSPEIGDIFYYKQKLKTSFMKWVKAEKEIGMPLTDYLENLINEEFAMGHLVRVSVGTDSKRSGRGYKFATVVVLTIKEDLGGGVIWGRGGKIISATYHVPVYGRNKAGVNERMLIEVGKSIEVATEISPVLDKLNVKLEIHADINPDPRWESNKALSEAIGYILGMGYEFKVKPESTSASYAADKFAA